MTRLIAEVRSAAAGGRFVSVWSFLAALVLSLTLMAPTSDGPPAAVALAGVATWAVMAAALGALAAAERALREPAARVGVVFGGVLVIAVTRPFVQDAWLRALAAPPPPEWQLPSRVATNVVAWLVVFTAIAVLVNALRSLREANALLREAAAALAAAGEEASAYVERAHEAVGAASATIERHLDDLGTVDVASIGAAATSGEDVRAFAADVIRPASHALTGLAAADLAAAEPAQAARLPMRSAGRIVRLRVPPRIIVTVLYLACLLPYAVRSASGVELLVGSALVVVGGVVVDGWCRRRRVRRRGGAFQVGVFLGAAVGCGAALSLLGAAFGAPPLRAVVPLVVYPLLALAVAACAGTVHALQVEQHRLSGTIDAAQRAVRAGTRPARTALGLASELLHRDGQGRCTVFAIEHPHPSAVQLGALEAELRELLVRVRDVFDAPGRSDVVSLDALLATWGHVIDLRAEVAPAARDAFDAGTAAAHDAYDVVAEGILNAVKHSGGRRVDVGLDVVATGAGPALRVRVQSFAPAAPGAQLRPASHVRALGGALRSTPQGALLEAVFSLDEDGAHGSVVSAEHPR